MDQNKYHIGKYQNSKTKTQGVLKGDSRPESVHNPLRKTTQKTRGARPVEKIGSFNVKKPKPTEINAAIGARNLICGSGLAKLIRDISELKKSRDDVIFVLFSSFMIPLLNFLPCIY